MSVEVNLICSCSKSIVDDVICEPAVQPQTSAGASSSGSAVLNNDSSSDVTFAEMGKKLTTARKSTAKPAQAKSHTPDEHKSSECCLPAAVNHTEDLLKTIPLTARNLLQLPMLVFIVDWCSGALLIVSISCFYLFAEPVSRDFLRDWALLQVYLEMSLVLVCHRILSNRIIWHYLPLVNWRFVFMFSCSISK